MYCYTDNPMPDETSDWPVITAAMDCDPLDIDSKNIQQMSKFGFIYWKAAFLSIKLERNTEIVVEQFSHLALPVCAIQVQVL